MKELKQYILEVKKTKHTLFPKDQRELEQMIKDEIQKNGIRCSLNHIDVSKVKSMMNLFNEGGRGIRFNGDISEWNVSNVVYMTNMFADSIFNGDISEWDVSKVTTMCFMFESAEKFNQDISKWDVSKVTDMSHMFKMAKSFNQNLSKWDVSGVKKLENTFAVFYSSAMDENYEFQPKWKFTD